MQYKNQPEKRIIVTGVLGQDGANMSEYLLRMPNCKVYGMMRRSATPNFINIKGNKINKIGIMIFLILPILSNLNVL